MGRVEGLQEGKGGSAGRRVCQFRHAKRRKEKKRKKTLMPTHALAFALSTPLTLLELPLRPAATVAGRGTFCFSGESCSSSSSSPATEDPPSLPDRPMDSAGQTQSLPAFRHLLHEGCLNTIKPERKKERKRERGVRIEGSRGAWGPCEDCSRQNAAAGGKRETHSSSHLTLFFLQQRHPDLVRMYLGLFPGALFPRGAEAEAEVEVEEESFRGC